MVDVITRTSKGSALTRAEIDKDLESLRRVTLLGGVNTTNHVVNKHYGRAGGNEYAGIAVPYAGKVIAISFSARNLQNTETLAVELEKNDTGQGASYRLSATGTSGAPVKSAYSVLGTPLSFAAGDLLNFFIQACPATVTTLYSEVCMLIELNY